MDSWAGLSYLLIFPLKTINGWAMGSRRWRKANRSDGPEAGEGADGEGC